MEINYLILKKNQNLNIIKTKIIIPTSMDKEKFHEMNQGTKNSEMSP